MSIQNINKPMPFNGVNDVPNWTLGDRMRRALRHAGIGVGAMADDLGVSVATVGRWLNDRGPVKRHVIRAWALTCGVDEQWLETGTATPEGGRSDVVRHQGLEPRTRWFGGFAAHLHKRFGRPACWCPGPHHPSCPSRVTRADLGLVA